MVDGIYKVTKLSCVIGTDWCKIVISLFCCCFPIRFIFLLYICLLKCVSVDFRFVTISFLSSFFLSRFSGFEDYACHCWPFKAGLLISLLYFTITIKYTQYYIKLKDKAVFICYVSKRRLNIAWAIVYLVYMILPCSISLKMMSRLIAFVCKSFLYNLTNILPFYQQGNTGKLMKQMTKLENVGKSAKLFFF